MQKKILKGLQWLWLLFDTHHTPDATAEEFLKCIFNTPWSWSLAMVSLAWHAVAVTPGQAGCSNRASISWFSIYKSRDTQKLSGMPLTLAIATSGSLERAHNEVTNSGLPRALVSISWDLEAFESTVLNAYADRDSFRDKRAMGRREITKSGATTK